MQISNVELPPSQKTVSQCCIEYKYLSESYTKQTRPHHTVLATLYTAHILWYISQHRYIPFFWLAGGRACAIGRDTCGAGCSTTCAFLADAPSVTDLRVMPWYVPIVSIWKPSVSETQKQHRVSNRNIPWDDFKKLYDHCITFKSLFE